MSVGPTASQLRAKVLAAGGEPILSPVIAAMDELLDAFTAAMQEFDTATLLAIAENWEKSNPSGWIQRCIRDYVAVWR